MQPFNTPENDVYLLVLPFPLHAIRIAGLQKKKNKQTKTEVP